MTEHRVLTPSAPKAVLGDYVQGGPKEPAARRIGLYPQALYDTVAVAKPHKLPRELSPPLSFTNVGQITPLDYVRGTVRRRHRRSTDAR